jgi:hypothetical protein
MILVKVKTVQMKMNKHFLEILVYFYFKCNFFFEKYVVRE